MKKIFIFFLGIFILYLCNKAGEDIDINYTQETLEYYSNLDNKLITSNINPNNNYSGEDLYKYVASNSLMGYINKTGEIAIIAKYPYAMDFHDGLALVRGDDGYYYIDSKGEDVFKKRYIYASNFSNSRAVIKEKGSKNEYKIIDVWGNIKSTVNASTCYGFVEGLAPFLEKEKNETIKKDYTIVREYSNGITMIEENNTPYEEDNRMEGFINKDGNIVVEPIYKRVNNFNDGIAIVCDENNMIILINKDGKEVLKTNYYYDPIAIDTQVYSEGLIPVKQDGKWGYINVNGEIEISFEYEYAAPFSEGLAAVSFSNGKWGYIDVNGNLIIKPKFEYVGKFSEGVAPIYKDRFLIGRRAKVGFIDKKGNLVIDSIYSDFYSADESLDISEEMENDLIEIYYESDEAKWRGYIDINNNVIFKENF